MSKISFTKSKKLLQEKYGFEFPDDFFSFWEFANELNPNDPLVALEGDHLGIYLAGPFEILAGKLDQPTPRLKWRHNFDPPEFFTILTGPTDGLHWGYWLDDPESLPYYVASYFSNDAYDISINGNTIFEAFRFYLEESYSTWQEYRGEETEKLDSVAFYEKQIEKIDFIREILKKYSPCESQETGEEYQDYPFELNPPRIAIAPTFDKMGIVAPTSLYRPMKFSELQLEEHLKDNSYPKEILQDAHQALNENFPATALQISKYLWAYGYKDKDYTLEIMSAAYEGLGRLLLKQVWIESYNFFHQGS